VFCYWMARHLFGGGLAYHGWGGAGKQVRDVVHVDDVLELVRASLGAWSAVSARTFNAGGGTANTLSLIETTALCAEITGKKLALGSVAKTDISDVRAYVSDHAAITAAIGWKPVKNPRVVLGDLFDWLRSDAERLRPYFR
jgi:CDP-paratose 2-epimerase